jgi:tRNA 2-thiouridine synthesizing protein A
MTHEELKSLKVDQTVDARGTACPGPLLEAKRGIAKVPKGGTMEVLSSDEGTNDDIPLWCKKIGHEYLGTITDAGYWRIFVRRVK